MRFRNTITDRSHTLSHRPGRIGWVLLMILVVTFFLGILVINSFFVTEIRVQQENATDAAALAAAEVLADEALLYADPSIFSCEYRSPAPDRRGPDTDEPPAPKQTLFCQAVQAGIEFGRRNAVGGKSFDIRPADLFFDVVNIADRSIAGTLPADANSPVDFGPPLTLAQKRHINSVQVVGKSTESRENSLRLPINAFFSRQMITRSEAVLDGNIHGFHTDPAGSVNIPLAPLALGAANWSEQVESMVDPTFATPTDGPLPYGTFTVTIGAGARDPDARNPRVYSPILLIGASTVAEAVGQFNPSNPGITPAQYGKYCELSRHNTLALDIKTLRLSLPGSSRLSDGDLAQLEENLKKLKEKRLIWPLYSGYDDDGQPDNVVISGFVAARVTEVKRVTYSIVIDKHGNAVPNGKRKGFCNQNPGKGKHPHKGKEKGNDRDDDRPDRDGRRNNGDQDGDRSKDERPGNGNKHRKHDAGESCVEFTALQVKLRPTLLATSTGIVCVKDWPTGPQHQFRFPNAYVKRIRLMK